LVNSTKFGEIPGILPKWRKFWEISIFFGKSDFWVKMS
jgi:hypothetical protein